MSAGTYLQARLAERCGGPQFSDASRIGSYLAALSALPCAPLLIADLGDPKRFHHMLRVWKPTSPMNLGSWILTAYTPVCFLAAFRERFLKTPGKRRTFVRLADWAVRSTDLIGIPLALGLAGYTGVLLSTTSTPVWCKNPWLGPLFSASSIHSGATALSMCLPKHSPSLASVEKIDEMATVVEAVAVAGYVKHAGKFAAPLLTGSQSRTFLAGAVGAGLVLPAVLKALSPRKKSSFLTGALALGGALALRWAIVEAGKPSALNPDAARGISSPRGTPAPR